MRFQTHLTSRRGQSIYCAGRLIPVDQQLCVEVDDPEVIAEFRAMPGEWTDRVVAVTVPAVTAAPPAIKDATQFVRDLAADAELRGKIEGFRSAAVRRSYAESLGYRFTDAELQVAVARHQNALGSPQAPAAEPPTHPGLDPRAGQEQPAGALEGPKTAGPETQPATGGWKVPREGEDWPDPQEGMPMQYLRAMAAAYQVKVPRRATAAELVAKISAAMYE